MSAREVETLARRLRRIAVRGALTSNKRFKAPFPFCDFYTSAGQIQDSWRHLASWLIMDRQHVLKGKP